MKKIVDGVTFYRRPPSSACPKGAWSTDHFHCHWAASGWAVYRTGVEYMGSPRTVTEARRYMAQKEKEISQSA